MQTAKLLLASLVVLSSLVSACALINTQHRDESFTVTGPARLEGDVSVGHVMVHGADTSQIRIQATLRQARQTSFQTTQSGNTIRIDTHTTAGFASSAGQAAVQIIATVPWRTELRLSSSTGDIYVDEITGHIVLTTSGGRLQLSDCQGQIELTNQTGTTACRRVDGTFVVRSGAGSVILDEVGGSFDIETDSGDIHLGGQLAGELTHRLSSITGAIDVAIIDTPNLRLHANSETGLVRCMLALGDRSITDNQCSGILGSGGGTLQINTTTGRITVQ